MLSSLLEDKKSHKPLAHIPVGISPTDLTYTVDTIDNWITMLTEYCLINVVPLLCVSCDNASAHRSWIANQYIPEESSNLFEFPDANWPFQLAINENFGYPIIPFPDQYHWFRCMIAVIFNTRRLVMIGKALCVMIKNRRLPYSSSSIT